MPAPYTADFSELLPLLGTDAFPAALKKRVEALGNKGLPLQEGLQHAAYALDDAISAMILDTEESEGKTMFRMGLFYDGIIAGCSCADDPTPLDRTNEYCVIGLELDRQSGQATIQLLES